MTKAEAYNLVLNCPDPAAVADLALMAREELKARDFALDVSVRQGADLVPDALEAVLYTKGSPAQPEQPVDLAGLNHEQCLMAILDMVDKAGLTAGRTGYSDKEEEIVNHHLEELGYL